MMRMWRILERLSDAGRLLFRGLRTLFPTIRERPEPLFLLLLLVSPSAGDEGRQTTFKDWRGTDIDPLPSENKILHAQLAFFEDAKARAIYDITKVGTIQMVCVQAQRKVESQLRACQNMIHAKDKELTKALTELSRAKDLLANLGVPGYTNPKDPTRI
ncbi:hypothetical protein Fot_06821 [Forsythia ovata]|uniref:Uncharacterized protein n=1 Tax=Forsythia ovata TaxID=205694 RepID=A0ABD1WUE0_9LAMI